MFFDGVDGDDAGLVERGDGAGLALESGAAVGVAGRLARQDLEGDLASEFRVLSQIDFACRPRPASAGSGSEKLSVRS